MINAVSKTAEQNRPISMTKVLGGQIIVRLPMAASHTFYDGYGKFVYLSSNVGLIGSGSAGELFGWANVGDLTGSATASATKVDCNIALDACYEIPLDATVTKANLVSYIGDVMDLVQSTYQYADNNGSTNKVIQCVGFNYYGAAALQQTLIARMTPKEIGQTSV